MVIFRKYQSIPNDSNVKNLDYLRSQGFDNPAILWYATEKVHGANFSFIYTAKTEVVTFAQRSGIIAEGVNFMNHLAFVEPYVHKVKALGAYLNCDFQIVCEYYGDGIINKGAIDYFLKGSGKKALVAFDIVLPETDVYIEYPYNFKLLDNFNFPRVEVIDTGTFDELMQLSLVFDSHQSDVLIRNYAEGLVLKPFCDLRYSLNSDSHQPIKTKGERVIIKRISDAFV